MSPVDDTDVVVEPWQRLGRYVGAQEHTHEEFLRECIEGATALVHGFVGKALERIPAPVLDLAIIQTGSELFARKDSPSGLQQFSEGTMNPVRLARDPMTSSYPLLRRYVRGLA